VGNHPLIWVSMNSHHLPPGGEPRKSVIPPNNLLGSPFTHCWAGTHCTSSLDSGLPDEHHLKPSPQKKDCDASNSPTCAEFGSCVQPP
jgi:hypothetical protein